MESNPNGPTFICDYYDLHWQMTRIEKIAMFSLLSKIKPEASLEIGTYKGGSLQVLSEFSKKVYSIDISDEPRKALSQLFKNVVFNIGDSREILADTMRKIQSNGEELQFILVDGNHSSDGVKNDINIILKTIRPSSDVHIVCHDSFNPDARNGILSASWAECPNVQFVEVDFVPGVYHREPFDTAQAKSMWGGLTYAKLTKNKRSGDLRIYQSQKGLFDAVLKDSVAE